MQIAMPLRCALMIVFQPADFKQKAPSGEVPFLQGFRKRLFNRVFWGGSEGWFFFRQSSDVGWVVG